MSIAVSTNGASPMLAKKIKQELQTQFDESYEQYLEFLFEARQLIKQSRLSKNKKEEYLLGFLDTSLLQVKAQKDTIRELQSLVNKDSDYQQD